MANPARPSTGQVIDTPWGLAVADTVTRRFPNAATRDADLAGKTTAELLGQTVVLTDSGSLLVYTSALLGWRPPWNTGWGMPIAPVVQSADLNCGGSPGSVYMEIVACPFVAGRRYLVASEYCYVSDNIGYTQIVCDGANSLHRTNINGNALGETMRSPLYFYNATTTRTANVTTIGVSINFQGTKGQGRLSITDVGPGANPTALVLGDTGELVVEPELLDEPYRSIYEAQAAEQERTVELLAELDAGA